MELLQIEFTPFEEDRLHFSVKVKNLTRGGEGYLPKVPLPLVDFQQTPPKNWRHTLLKILESDRFNTREFSEEERQWMAEQGLLSADRSSFPHSFALLTNVGLMLCQSIFPAGSDTEKLLTSALSTARSNKTHLHIRFSFPENASKYARLPDYPWELLHDGQKFLSQDIATFSRYIEYSDPHPAPPPAKTINVLLVSSGAYDSANQLKKLPKAEREVVIKGLKQAEAKQVERKLDAQVRLTVLEHTTLADLRKFLQENRGDASPHILHFDGHGFFGRRCEQCRRAYLAGVTQCEDDQTPLSDVQGYLLFEHDDCEADYISAKEFGELFRKASLADEAGQTQGVTVAVLSACKSGMSLGSESVFNGMAQNLIGNGVPAVVAMQYSVRADAAIAFVESFYASLCQKESLARAVSLGRSAMGAEGNQWYRPVLYLRWQDDEGGKLFSSSEGYSEDWSILLAQTKANLNVIQDKIGNEVFLPRIPTLNELKLVFNERRVAVLLGPSGCGKTVIAKAWAEKELNAHKILWWNARSFDVSDFQTFQSYLGLTHSLSDVLSAHSDAPAYLVVDGLERIFHATAFQNLAILIHMLRLDSESSPWRILIPCQLEEWSRVQFELTRANISVREWQTMEVSEPSADDLEPVWRAFPTLRPLRFQQHLQSLLLKPKVLDLLATKLSTGTSVDTTQWVGESNLIDWFWETEVSRQPNATARAAFLKDLGEKQADSLETETPTDTFSISDLGPLDSLISDRLCREREERLSFCHDLYGDWARQRVLLGKTNSLREYLQHRVSSPLWHRAVRLYGLQLLEKDVKKWRSALVSLYDGSKTPDLTSDLLLESVIFAANPIPLLESIWSDLAKNNGLLLRRLLGRFLHIATVPNPLIRAVALQLSADLETTAATIQRIPYWPYWLPMLQFLHSHLTDVIGLVPKQIAEVTDTWLRRGGENWPLRQEVSELAIATAERLLESRQVGDFVSDEDKLSETVYRAALAGAQALPEQVENFALRASARIQIPLQELEADSQVECLIKRTITDSIYGTYELELSESTWSIIDDPENNIDPIMFRDFSSELGEEYQEKADPWQDGPLHKVDSAFRKVCLTTDAILPLIIARPSTAREVLLALLIEEPRVRHSELSIACDREWYPPFYTQGPLLFFIRHQPTEGLELILRLVNFETERWADIWQRDNQPIPNVEVTTLGKKYCWLGDQKVYYWYYNYHYCLNPVTTALQVLEKWLYEEIDAKKPVDNIIELILQRSNSIAFAGLLSAVGRKFPTLLQSCLRQLLAVPEFHIWELHHRPVSEMDLRIAWWWQPSEVLKLVHEWYKLPHRERGLHVWVKDLFLNVPEMRTFFEEVRSSWLIRLQSNNSEDPIVCYLEQLVDAYNFENYAVQTHPEYGDLWFFNSPRQQTEEEWTLAEASNRRLLRLTFPTRCRELLDKGQPLQSEQLEKFWNTIQQIATFPPLEDELGSYDVNHSILGGIAVLLYFHWESLEQYPDRKEWCLNQIVEGVHRILEVNEFDLERNLGWEWDIFCAQAVPIIWSKLPDSNTWRECIALLATCSRYSVVSIAFADASKFRQFFYNDFKRLQHLLFRWATIKWKWDSTRYGSEPAFDIQVERNREIKAFLNRSLSPDFSNWEEIITQVWKELSDKHLHEKYNQPSHFGPCVPGQFPGLDFRLVQAAYSWLPSINQTSNQVERQEWITFWKETFNYSRQIREKDRTLSGWSGWFSRNVACLITQLQPIEKPEDFWKPILSFGVQENRWIEDFLTQWFAHGLGSIPVSDSFIRDWDAMVEFAFSSPEWQFDPRLCQYGLEELWCHLMGLSSNVSELWTSDQKSVVKQMHGIYQRWAQEHLNKARCALSFVIFLLNPAAQDLRFDGLSWLYTASQTNEFWSEHTIEERLASLLDKCWHSHQSDLRQHPEAFAAFKQLLRKLADLQNSLALEIQQRIASNQET